MNAVRLAQAIGVLGALVCAVEASASYTGLSLEFSTVVVGGQSYWRYRIYVNFSSPNDYLTGVNGSPTNGALTIETRHIADTGPGTNFFNPGGAGSNTASYQEVIDSNPALEHGTFATIGVPIADMGSGPDGGEDETAVSPGFPNFIAGNQLINNNLGWFTPGPVEQGRAGYAGDGDLSNRVLFAQLTTNVNERVRGTVNIFGVTSEGLAGGSNFIVAQQTFNYIPAPGGVALLAVVAGLGRRRRVGVS